MQIRPIAPGSTVGAGRGEAVICIAPRGEKDDLAECLRRVLAHTPGDVTVLLCGHGERAGAPDTLAVLEQAGARAAEPLELATTGLAASIDAALTASAPADLILLSARCLVAEGWFDGLRAAAHSDSTVATVTPLGGGGVTSIGVPELLEASNFDAAAAAVRASSPRLRPRLPAAGGHCTYIRRSALELVAGFDSDRPAPPVAGPEFSQRCVGAGLAHVAADDVLVFVPGEHRDDREDAHDPGRDPRLARSVGVARRSLTRFTVLIDARNLTGPVNGSQLHVLELIAAIARSGQARTTALLPSDLGEHARLVLEALPEVELIASPATVLPGPRADVAHRPFQVWRAADLNFLAQSADRLVITHQDLISYRNPSYFSSSDAWEEYRELTRRALAAADRVLFFSAHVRDDAFAEELVEAHRATVVPIGVDHHLTARDLKPIAPAGAGRFGGVESMVCIGADYRHKNRLFALRLVTELQRRHGWDGRLILAGPHMPLGSSAADEERLLRQDQRLSDAVVDLGVVSEAEKAWLLGHVRLVLSPSVHEGFGLVPFEAADHDVPCLWAPGTALSEILPDAAAGIVPWDVAAGADRALALMRDEQARASSLAAVREAGSTLRWDVTADRLIEVYRATSSEPAAPAGAYERRGGLMRGGLSDDALRLLGPDGLLPGRFERPLLALAAHPKFGTPVFRAIEAGYRASQRWRRP